MARDPVRHRRRGTQQGVRRQARGRIRRHPRVGRIRRVRRHRVRHPRGHGGGGVDTTGAHGEDRQERQGPRGQAVEDRGRVGRRQPGRPGAHGAVRQRTRAPRAAGDVPQEQRRLRATRQVRRRVQGGQGNARAFALRPSAMQRDGPGVRHPRVQRRDAQDRREEQDGHPGEPRARAMVHRRRRRRRDVYV